MRRFGVLALLLGLALLASGCARIQKPNGWARPMISDGTLYVSLDKGKLSALDASSYEKKWVFPGADQFSCGAENPTTRKLEGLYGEPVVGKDMVYFGAYDGHVYAVKKNDGSCQWSFATGDPIVAGVVLDDERLYVPSTDGNLYVLDPSNGKEVQRVETGEIYATPFLTKDSELYVPTMDGELWKFKTNPLELVWSPAFKVNAGLLTTPVLSGDVVVAGGIGETLYGVGQQDGKKKWSVDGGNWFWGEPAESDGTVFATTLDGEIYRIDGATGDGKVLYKAASPIRAGVVLDGDTLITVDSKGVVLFLNAKDGTLIKDVDLKKVVFATPIVNDGKLLVLARDGTLFAIDLQTYAVQGVAN